MPVDTFSIIKGKSGNCLLLVVEPQPVVHTWRDRLEARQNLSVDIVPRRIERGHIRIQRQYADVGICEDQGVEIGFPQGTYDKTQKTIKNIGNVPSKFQCYFEMEIPVLFSMFSFLARICKRSREQKSA